MALALLPREEADLIEYHLGRLGAFRSKNREKYAYYEAKQKVQALGHSLPARMRAVEIAVGFSTTVIDTLEERLEWEGWGTEGGNDAFGLDRVFRENDLDVEASSAHTDALITGSSFVIVGRGNAEDGEPAALITVESPNRVTGEWDNRLRRLSSALSVDVEETGEITAVTLFLPNQNVQAKRVGSMWVQAVRDQHDLGRVQVAQLPNKPRGSRQHGRSEITPALRGYTDEAVRTLLGMNVHREFYQAPQRYLLNASEEWFQAADGSGMSGWDAVQGRMLAVPAGDEDDPEPKIGQFSPAPPTPYLEMIRGLAGLVSSEGAVPLTYLGFSSDNPPSADAIRALEARLIKKAERRQATFGRGWREVAALVLLIRDGSLPADFYTLTSKWRDPATPTRAASADAAQKLVAAGILLPDSDVTYDRIGLTPYEKKTLVAEKRRAKATARLDGLAAAAANARQPAPAPVAAPDAAPVVTDG